MAGISSKDPIEEEYPEELGGYKGVFENSRDGKWYAYLQINKHKKHLGAFDNKRDAILARQKAEAAVASPSISRGSKKSKDGNHR